MDTSSLIQKTKTEEVKEIEGFTSAELGLHLLNTKKNNQNRKGCKYSNSIYLMTTIISANLRMLLDSGRYYLIFKKTSTKY